VHIIILITTSPPIASIDSSINTNIVAFDNTYYDTDDITYYVTKIVTNKTQK